MSIETKICGLSTSASVDAAVRAGADMLGFNFFPRSPRFVKNDVAHELANQVSGNVIRTGLVVDFTNAEIAEILARVPLDLIQLHGSETPERAAEIRSIFKLPVMKVLAVSEAADLARTADYSDVVDRFLFDAKPPKGADRPGGNAVTFDWTLLQGLQIDKPWLLAGGLTPENVAEAVKISGTRGVDVSSGIESAPGVKDDGLIRSFIHAVRSV
jgi:phosphoribosylanthranilate isomerase